MPMKMECPFFENERKLKLTCEGGVLKFPDADARSEFVLGYCSHPHAWRKCPIAHCLENYYYRKEDTLKPSSIVRKEVLSDEV